MNCMYSNAEKYTKAVFYRDVYISLYHFDWKARYQVSNEIAKITRVYKVDFDSLNRISTISYFDKGKLTTKDFDNVSITRFEYGANYQKRSYYDKQNKPVKNHAGVYATVIYSENNCLTINNLDEANRLIPDNDSAYILKWEIDAQGRVTKETYYDQHKNQIQDKNGFYYTTFTTKYYKDFQITEKRYFDANGKPIANKYGYAASITKIRKDNEDFLESKYLDTDNQLKIVKKFYCAQIKCILNENGDPIEIKYYDDKSQLFSDKNKVAIEQRTYYKNGLLKNCKFFNNLQMPIENPILKYASLNLEYDSRGNTIKETYSDMNNELVKNLQYAVRVIKYDQLNRKTESLMYNADNMLIKSEDGCIQKWKYDDNDNIVEESHWDENCQLKENKRGNAIIRWEYDANGNVIKTKYYNSKEILVSEN